MSDHIHELELDNGFRCKCGYSSRDETPLASEQSTNPPQKPLLRLLDEMEEEAKTRLTEIEKIAFLNSKVPALVKALRRATEMIIEEESYSGPTGPARRARLFDELSQLLRESADKQG